MKAFLVKSRVHPEELDIRSSQELCEIMGVQEISQLAERSIRNGRGGVLFVRELVEADSAEAEVNLNVTLMARKGLLEAVEPGDIVRGSVVMFPEGTGW